MIALFALIVVAVLVGHSILTATEGVTLVDEDGQHDPHTYHRTK